MPWQASIQLNPPKKLCISASIQGVGTGNKKKILFPTAKAHVDPKKDLTIDLS